MDTPRPTETLDVAVKQAEEQIVPLAAEAEAIAAGIIDQAGYDRAAEYLKRNAAVKKMAVALLDPFRADAYGLYQKIQDRIKAVILPLDTKRAIVEPVAARWLQDQERKRQEEQRRLEAEERKRQEDEQLRRAEAAAIAGDKEEADAILQQPTIVTPIVMPAAPKVNGVAQVTRWKAEVTDLMSLIVAIAKGQAPLAAVKADMQVLDALARSHKGEMRIPGVKPVAEAGLRIGGRMSA